MTAPDATQARLGPKVTIERDCFGCAFERSERYAVQSDSGCDVKCTHPSHGDGGKYIGDTTWRTPDWCPVTTDATPARGDVKRPKVWLVRNKNGVAIYDNEFDVGVRVSQGDIKIVTECVAVPVAEIATLTAERDALAARVREMEGALCAAWVQCEHLHHAKKDQHKLGESCPVEARINAVLYATPAPTGVHTQHDTEGGTDA